MQRRDDQLHCLRRDFTDEIRQPFVVQLRGRVIQQQRGLHRRPFRKKFDLGDQQRRREQFLLAAGYSIFDLASIQTDAKLCAVRPDLCAPISRSWLQLCLESLGHSDL